MIVCVSALTYIAFWTRDTTMRKADGLIHQMKPKKNTLPISANADGLRDAAFKGGFQRNAT